jgi:hypothetical protein
MVGAGKRRCVGVRAEAWREGGRVRRGDKSGRAGDGPVQPAAAIPTKACEEHRLIDLVEISNCLQPAAERAPQFGTPIAVQRYCWLTRCAQDSDENVR